MIATAPGKLIVAGEYAVLDGATAIAIAVDRRAIARRSPTPAPSPFLAALASVIADRFPDADARDIAVDSSAFYRGDRKLGLGSSAAATVAAARLALANASRDELFEVVKAAHDEAQGVRGSGADLAASLWGGAIALTGTVVEPLPWPRSFQLVAFDTGIAASTRELIAAVRARESPMTRSALAAIGARAIEVAMAWRADRGVVDAFRAAARAFDALAAATALPLVPPCVGEARTAIERLGGAVRTTGAGGGDVAIAVVPGDIAVTAVHGALIQVGCTPLPLTVDPTGVDTRLEPQ